MSLSMVEMAVEQKTESFSDTGCAAPDVAYVYPTPVEVTKDGAARITAEQIDSWRSKGFALVDGLLDTELAESCISEANVALGDQNVRDFGSSGALEFPTGFANIDRLTLNKSLQRAAADLLGYPVHDLRLMQSDVWGKTGPDSNAQNVDESVIKLSNSDQLYLSDEEDCGGGTAVVARSGPQDPAYRPGVPNIDMPGQAGRPFINDRTLAERYFYQNEPNVYEFRQALYARERRAKFKVGSVLLYRHDVWHRGTPLKTGSRRIVCNLGFKKKHCEWVTVWNSGWARKNYLGIVEKIIGEATPEQRVLLGFPMPGDSYWNEFTVKAVTARYGPFGFDGTPYLEKLPK